MNPAEQFIENMKRHFGMSDKNVLQAIQEEPQHDFIMETMGVSIGEASNIITDAEEYLMNTLDNPFL